MKSKEARVKIGLTSSKIHWVARSRSNTLNCVGSTDQTEILVGQSARDFRGLSVHPITEIERFAVGWRFYSCALVPSKTLQPFSLAFLLALFFGDSLAAV